MSAIDDALDFVDDNNTIGSGVSVSAARSDLASLRAAVAERDAAIARARELLDAVSDAASRIQDWSGTRLGDVLDKCDAWLAENAAAIRARNETKEE